MELVIAAILVGIVLIAVVWAFDAVTGKAVDILFGLLEPLFVSKNKKDQYLKASMEVLAESWRERCDAQLDDARCRCESCQRLSGPSRDRRIFLTGFFKGMSESLPHGSLWQHWAFRSARHHARLLDERSRLDEELRRLSRTIPNSSDNSETESAPEDDVNQP